MCGLLTSWKRPGLFGAKFGEGRNLSKASMYSAMSGKKKNSVPVRHTARPLTEPIRHTIGGYIEPIRHTTKCRYDDISTSSLFALVSLLGTHILYIAIYAAKKYGFDISTE